tara:strand:- start:658 stop:1041 length:384 start_codon:yes stop_codon:yes gene_type:complete
MDAQFLMSAFWFILGVISYRTVSYLISYGRSAMIIQQTVIGILLMLKYYDKVFQSEKDKILEKMKEDIPEASASHKLLDLSLDAWRFQSIRSIKNYLPQKLQHFANFNNWDEAMRYLNKIEKGLKNG